MDKDKPDEHTKKKERISTTKRALSEAWLKANKLAYPVITHTHYM